MSLEPIPTSLDFTRCYGCGPNNPRGLGLVFAVDKDAGRVEARWTPPEHVGGYGTMVHGGVTTTLLDEAMGWALWGLLRRLGVTRTLEVAFLRPVFVGREVTVVGWVESHGDAEATVKAEVRDGRGRASAAGTGRFSFVSAERVRDVMPRAAGGSPGGDVTG